MRARVEKGPSWAGTSLLVEVMALFKNDGILIRQFTAHKIAQFMTLTRLCEIKSDIKLCKKDASKSIDQEGYKPV